MKKKFILKSLAILVAISPVVYLPMVWDSMPETFQTTFGLGAAPESAQKKDALWIATISVSAVAVLVFLLMRNLERVDPKVNEATPKSTFNKFGALLLIFLTVWNYYFIISVKNSATINVNITFAGVGLLIAVIGNYLNSLKPNYVAGIRLPWTLNDPENWRQTHRLASKVWFAGGIVLMLVSLALPKNLFMPLFTSIMVVLVLIPSVYSFRIYKSKSNR